LGEAEFVLDSIIAEHKIGHRYQYLIKWVSKPDEENCWLPHKKLKQCEVLDKWLAAKKALEHSGG
jgi:hypothetical protein